MFAVALAIRVAWLHQPQPPLMGDAEDYFEVSRSLLAGEITGRLANVVRLRGPGYPLFLAGVFAAAGTDVRSAFQVQAVLGSLTCAFIFGIGLLLAGRRVGVGAAAIAIVYPPLVQHCGLLLSETFAMTWFWLGILLLIRGLRNGRSLHLVGAGLAIAVASLTRPTVLPALPALALAAWLATPGPARTRMRNAGIFSAAMLGPVLAWSAYAASTGLQPIAGAAGARFMLRSLAQAAHPNYGGWAPHGFPEAIPDWGPVLSAMPSYPMVGAADLVFHHLWFTDNIWRQPMLISPTSIDGVHRGMLFLAAAGLPLAARRWRTYAPLLALAMAFAGVTLHWIEPRKGLPLVPILFILAALFVARAVETVPLRTLAVWAALSAALAALALRFDAGLVLLVHGVSGLGTVAAGRALDVAATAAIVLWGAATAALSRRDAGERAARWRDAVPVALLGGLFASYAWVGSGPRWRDWQLEGRGWTLRWRVDVPGDVAVRHATWLVDLASPVEPPLLGVRLDGQVPEELRWRRVACSTEGDYICGVLDMLADFAGPPQRARRQWWAATQEIERSGGAFELAIEPRGEGVVLGGTLHRPGELPLLPVVDPGRVSIFRWLVLEDGRRWEQSPSLPALAGARLTGELDATQRRLAAALETGQARPNIHLVLSGADGRELLY